MPRFTIRRGGEREKLKTAYPSEGTAPNMLEMQERMLKLSGNRAMSSIP